MQHSTPPLAQRMGQIAPFQVMELLARAHTLQAQGRSIIHMEVGEPDFATPAPIMAAGQQALAAGRTRYTMATGIPELRLAIAQFYQQHDGVTLDPQRIIVTPGASGALQLATAMLLNPGDEVLLADPTYPCNRNFIRLCDAEPKLIPTTAEQGYQLTAALVAEHWGPHTKAVLLASPSNPTGTLIEPTELAALLDVVEQRGGVLIVDEIYLGLVYSQQPARSALALSQNLLVINSFSKYFGMTGWRLGWLVVPDGYQREAEKLAQNLFISPPTLAQYAALAAFTPETLAICEQRRQEFQARRDYLLPALRGLGFAIAVEPQGAFYIYADCSRFTSDSYRFCFDLLEQTGVAITPGLDFGQAQPERYVRFAYTNSLENLHLAVERLGAYCTRT